MEVKKTEKIISKRCPKCGEIKNVSEFSKCASRKDGLQCYCKGCRSIAKPKEILPEDKKRCGKCKKIKSVCEFGRDDNKVDGLKCYCRNCRKTEFDIQKDKERKKEWYLDNRELTIKRSSKRQIEKREERNSYLRQYYKDNSHIYTWRSLVYRTLSGRVKDDNTFKLLGYSALELKEHLESLFTDGMSWDNYGEWHVDHIIPLTKFKEDTPINIVNSLSNLQPLWATTREINGVIYEGNLNKGFN